MHVYRNRRYEEEIVMLICSHCTRLASEHFAAGVTQWRLALAVCDLHVSARDLYVS
jgi:hypothetical protein